MSIKRTRTSSANSPDFANRKGRDCWRWKRIFV